MEGLTHRTRTPLVLPSQSKEFDFLDKALKHKQQLQQRRLPRVEEHNPSLEAKQALPKYLQTALVKPAWHPARPSRSPVEKRRAVQAEEARSTPRTAREQREVRRFQEVGLEIVEAPTTLTITTEQGSARIPPHHWLVIDPASPGQQLAGGGEISEGGSLAKRVPTERLHAGAAEANFHRASRGTSELALQHAARALELLREVDRELPGLRPVRCCTAQPTQGQVLQRLQRMQAVVALQANAAQVRSPSVLAKEPQAKADPGAAEACGQFTRGSLLQRGVQARVDFAEFAQRRYGNTIRAWWHLDLEENLKLGEKLFIRRCIDIGFRGNVTALWRFVDADRSGSVSMLELDPPGTLHLAAFKMLIDSRFNCNPDTIFSAVDSSRSGRLSRTEFIDALKGMHYDGQPGRLFELLDRRGMGYILPSDIAFLARWQPRPYLFTKPDFDGLQRFKDVCLELHRGLLRAWRKLLDRNGHMRLCWEEFSDACKKASRCAPQLGLALRTDVEIAAVWRALDEDCSGWISLREFDPVGHKEISQFKSWADSTYKSAVDAFRRIDVNGNGKIAHWELRACAKGAQGYQGNVELLFDCLDLNHAGVLTESEFKFLDNWDVEWDEWEARMWAAKAKQMLRNQSGSLQS